MILHCKEAVTATMFSCVLSSEPFTQTASSIMCIHRFVLVSKCTGRYTCLAGKRRGRLGEDWDGLQLLDRFS